MIKFKNEAAITSPLAVFYSSALMITLKIFYIYYVFPSEAYRGYIYNNQVFIRNIFINHRISSFIDCVKVK